MSGEPDSGTCSIGGSIIKTAVRLEMEPPSNNNNNNNNLTNNNNTMKNDDNDCDNDRVTGSSINYDSSDSIGIDSVSLIKLRCERCDIFETQSRTLMIAHTAQCGISSQHQLGNQDQGGGGGSIVVGAAGLNNIVPLNLLKDKKSVLNNNNNLIIKPENLQIRQSIQQQQASTTSTTTTTNTTSTTVNNNVNDPNKRKCFECDVCNMKFSNGANMRRHKMRHTGVKPYECRVCQKRFFRKDHLAEHFTTHTKTLPYHCPICNRGFQRQIAMRAHFQNEHVGQHDLVKTCPLCSYRAGTMKSLRVHFFNRHGIDLDNPGPGAPSSLLLALDPTNASHLLPNLAAAAAAAQNYSDSGDSLRSTDNATPPMHFLTPHVEISMADNNENFVCDPAPPNSTSGLEIQPCPSTRPNGGSPSSPHSADSNSNAPSSSHSLIPSMVQSARHLLLETSITPSISLIPIKQEPASNDDYPDSKPTRSHESLQILPNPNINVSSGDSSTPSSSLTSLIKVSPLKSLLREDLKRRISARANNRASRNSNNSSSNNFSNNNGNNDNNNTTSTNNTNSNSNINSSYSISNTLTVIAESSPTVATTSNGTITSTGAETTEMILASRRRNLQCLFCGIEFPDQTLYFLHKGCHSESNPWKCNICGEQCNNVYEFNSHLLSKSHQ